MMILVLTFLKNLRPFSSLATSKLRGLNFLINAEQIYDARDTHRLIVPQTLLSVNNNINLKDYKKDIHTTAVNAINTKP